MKRKKQNATSQDRYEGMTFGELLVASAKEMADIHRGRRKPSRVTRITVREAEVSAAPEFGAEKVRRIRSMMKLSQPVFAAALSVSPATVRSWERGARVPDGPSQRLLQVAEQDPEAVLKYVAPSKSRRVQVLRDGPEARTYKTRVVKRKK